MAADIRIRAGVHNLTTPQIADLRNAYGQIEGISDNRGFQFLAGLHGVPSWYCWHHQQNSRIA
jgi:tyrosinase